MEAVQVRQPDEPEPGDSRSVGPQGQSGHEPDAAFSASPDLPTTDFVTCYQLHYRRLVRALELAGADPSTAEDVAQEAFARALAHWRRIRRGPNPPGYVYTAGFRLLARGQRRRERESVQAEPALSSASAATGTDPTAATATSSVAVHTVLAAMPPRRRACAVMCLVVGLPVREAAEALGIADGTVRKHLEEARKELAVLLGPAY